jgi:ribosomal protein S12 methylthiotransferase
MNRNTRRANIEKKLNKLRERIPDIAIRTTMITGFPGETEKDAEELEEFIKEQRFARLGVFTFSPEEGTPAYSMDDQIPEDIKEERRSRIMLEQMDISREQNKSMVGKVFDVIVDTKEDETTYSGRTRYDAPEIDDAVIFTTNNDLLPGDIVKVMIEEAYDYDLQGKEVSDESSK